MPMTLTDGQVIFTPETVTDLLVTPLTASATALNPFLSTTVLTGSHVFRVPKVVADPSASWVAEGAEIPLSDAELDEVEVYPRKLAGLTTATRELLDDTADTAAEVIGTGLVRDLGRKINKAFVLNQGGNAPGGLESVPHATMPDLGTLESLDRFAEAVAHLEDGGAFLTGWLTSPSFALKLATLRDADGSNRNLLGVDPTEPSRRMIEGRPVFTDPNVPAGVVWGLDASRIYSVLRTDPDVVADSSVFFTSDRIAIRATMRATFAFPDPENMVRMEFAGAVPSTYVPEHDGN